MSKIKIYFSFYVSVMSTFNNTVMYKIFSVRDNLQCQKYAHKKIKGFFSRL